jgi:hypothetical protein
VGAGRGVWSRGGGELVRGSHGVRGRRGGGRSGGRGGCPLGVHVRAKTNFFF